MFKLLFGRISVFGKILSINDELVEKDKELKRRIGDLSTKSASYNHEDGWFLRCIREKCSVPEGKECSTNGLNNDNL